MALCLEGLKELGRLQDLGAAPDPVRFAAPESPTYNGAVRIITSKERLGNETHLTY